MKNFVQRGDTVTMTAPYNLRSGDGALVGALFGVSANDVAGGGEAELVTVGVFTLPKKAGAVAQGEPVFWDDESRVATTYEVENTRIGVCVVAAAAGDAEVAV